MSATELVVLLIEDERPMRRFLRALLQGNGHRLVEAETGAEGVTLAAQHNPDIVLLDLGLPDMDGLTVTTSLREWSNMPIIVLSARDKEGDKVRALDAGADDYLTKPFGAEELLARMRVAVRHSRQTGQEPASLHRFGDVEIDLSKRQVRHAGVEVHLTPLEYKLLASLVHNAGKVVTHRQLLKDVWGPNAIAQTHYLRVYMGQLRHKLETDPARPRVLLTEPAVGYRLRSE
jgi:two-component system KDP operon response regulator KdpE